MNNPWEYALSDAFIWIELDGERVRYNKNTGEIYNLSAYKNGEDASRVQVYRTGRGVVKFKVDGAAHRAMDVISSNLNGTAIRGYMGYPKNGDFSDLRAENIILVRTRESLFGTE